MSGPGLYSFSHYLQLLFCGKKMLCLHFPQPCKWKTLLLIQPFGNSFIMTTWAFWRSERFRFTSLYFILIINWLWILSQIHSLWNYHLTDYVFGNTIGSQHYWHNNTIFKCLYVLLFCKKFISCCVIFIPTLYLPKCTWLFLSGCSYSIHYSAFTGTLSRDCQKAYMTGLACTGTFSP